MHRYPGIRARCYRPPPYTPTACKGWHCQVMLLCRHRHAHAVRAKQVIEVIDAAVPFRESECHKQIFPQSG